LLAAYPDSPGVHFNQNLIEISLADKNCRKNIVAVNAAGPAAYPGAA